MKQELTPKQIVQELDKYIIELGAMHKAGIKGYKSSWPMEFLQMIGDATMCSKSAKKR